MTPVTDDPHDPRLGNVDEESGLQEAYLVLSDDERAKGFVRPLRSTYLHEACGAETIMGLAIAETYARDPSFYGGTYCATCGGHFPVGAEGQFVWLEQDGTTHGSKVGT